MATPGVSAKAHERQKLERLCRYITRPAVSEKRLYLTSGGNIRYQLKTPYRDGTTHVIFEPLDFIPKAFADAGQAFACIEDPVVIKKILDHIGQKEQAEQYSSFTISLPEKLRK